jgi:hypothetical protein
LQPKRKALPASSRKTNFQQSPERRATSQSPYPFTHLGVGPQLGYGFPVGDMQGFLGLKAYGEFDASNRALGWNTRLTFAISPTAPIAEAKPTQHHEVGIHKVDMRTPACGPEETAVFKMKTIRLLMPPTRLPAPSP